MRPDFLPSCSTVLASRVAEFIAFPIGQSGGMHKRSGQPDERGYRARAMATPASAPALASITHDSEADLRRNLAGHLAAAERLGTRLFVVDNASRDGTRDLLRAQAKRSEHLEVVELAGNRGFATAANVALARAGQADVMLVNPDVEIAAPEAVTRLAKHLHARPGVGIAAPRLVGPAGETQPSARRPASLAAMLGSLPGAGAVPPLRRVYERYLAPSLATDPVAVGWVIGAAMLIRRRALADVGGFDEGFFLYMEDADLCRRLNRAGWRVELVPGVRLRHGYARASSEAGATVLSSAARRRHVASLARYWRKHPRLIVGGER